MAENPKEIKSRREVDGQLDLLEAKLSKLKILYEQYFIEILPHPPDELHAEVRKLAKVLIKAPFKNSVSRFRLRTLIQRYHTYHTYWTRVNKQREEGTYSKDTFRANLRERQAKDEEQARSLGAKADQGLRQLFNSFQGAVKKLGSSGSQLSFENFKKNLIAKSKELKESHGAKKVHYKVVVKGGKVVVKVLAAASGASKKGE